MSQQSPSEQEPTSNSSERSQPDSQNFEDDSTEKLMKSTVGNSNQNVDGNNNKLDNSSSNQHNSVPITIENRVEVRPNCPPLPQKDTEPNNETDEDKKQS